MVFSMPFSTSTTPGIFLMASPTCGAQCAQHVGILAEQLDDDRLGRAGEIADHVLQELRELDVQHRLRLRDFGAHVGDHFFAAALAVALQLDGDVAGVGFGHRRQAQLQAGAARGAFHFRRRAQDLLHVGDHAVGFFERGAGRHDVVEDEAAFVHGGQQVASRVLRIAEVGAADQRRAAKTASSSGCSSVVRRTRS